MIEVTEDEQLESEIKQSEMIQEEISLALISIEETLDAITEPTEGTRCPHRRHSLNGIEGGNPPQLLRTVQRALWRAK